MSCARLKSPTLLRGFASRHRYAVQEAIRNVQHADNLNESQRVQIGLQHAASQATRTAKTATHTMATASAASSATAPAPVTQTEHAAVIGVDLGRRTSL